MTISKLLFAFAGVTLTLIGCATSDPTESSANDLTVDVATARACAVHDAFGTADLGNLTTVGFSELPARVRQALDNKDAGAYERFAVPSVGTVFIVQPVGTTKMTFFDSTGTALALASGAGALTWTNPASQPLECAGGGSGGPHGGGGPTGGGGGPGCTVCGNGACVDLETNDDNCGSCGNTCGLSSACRDGRCFATSG